MALRRCDTRHKKKEKKKRGKKSSQADRSQLGSLWNPAGCRRLQRCLINSAPLAAPVFLAVRRCCVTCSTCKQGRPVFPVCRLARHPPPARPPCVRGASTHMQEEERGVGVWRRRWGLQCCHKPPVFLGVEALRWGGRWFRHRPPLPGSPAEPRDDPLLPPTRPPSPPPSLPPSLPMPHSTQRPPSKHTHSARRSRPRRLAQDVPAACLQRRQNTAQSSKRGFQPTSEALKTPPTAL